MYHSTFIGTHLPALRLKATVSRFVTRICYIILTFDINLLKPTGYVMHQQV